MRSLRARPTIRRLMILIATGGVLFAAARSSERFRLCMRLAEEYAFLGSQEPWARGMVRCSTDREREIAEPSRMRAEYYARQSAKFRLAAWFFWEPIPSPDPPAP